MGMIGTVLATVRTTWRMVAAGALNHLIKTYQSIKTTSEQKMQRLIRSRMCAAMAGIRRQRSGTKSI